jgi:integrase
VACGTWPRKQVPITEIGTDLDVVTCLTCAAELGMDDRTSESQRLEALFIMSITLGLRPGELRKLAWDHVDLNQEVIPHVAVSEPDRGGQDAEVQALSSCPGMLRLH